MSKEWTMAVAAAEAAAQHKQSAEDEAQERFDAVRTRIEAAGHGDDATGTQEFKDWMDSRHETDEAWGAWAMAMDAKPAA